MKWINWGMLLGIALGIIIDLAEVADGVWTWKEVKWVFIIYAIVIAVLSYVNLGIHMWKQNKGIKGDKNGKKTK